MCARQLRYQPKGLCVKSDRKRYFIYDKCKYAKPDVSLCVVLKNWGIKEDAKISFTGAVKQGTVRDTDGTYTKVIFIEKVSTEPFEISIS